MSKLDWIKERIDQNWTPITVFEELLSQAGMDGISRSGFYRFLRRHASLFAEGGQDIPGLTHPIQHEPAEALQLDWGKLYDVVDPESGSRRTLWAFVGVMGFSRYMMVRLVWTNSIEVTFDAIESMLRELGGVPRRITSDNPKCFSITADYYDPLLNPAFVKLSEHYGFVPECLPPRDPKKKGKVERMMPFVRRIFEPYFEPTSGAKSGAKFCINKAQAYMSQKVALANERKHGTTRKQPIQVYTEIESVEMKDLPAQAFERVRVHYGIVRKDGYVRFDNRYYALTHDCIGKEATILSTPARISIYVGHTLQETYDRASEIYADSYKTHFCKTHHELPWQTVLSKNNHYLRMGEEIGESCKSFIEGLLRHSEGFVDHRKIWGVLTLAKKYDKNLLNQACDYAQRSGSNSPRAVKAYLERLMYCESVATKNNEGSEPNKMDIAGGGEIPSNQSNHSFVRVMSEYTRFIEEVAPINGNLMNQ